jgi:hypothetical protein
LNPNLASIGKEAHHGILDWAEKIEVGEPLNRSNKV